MDYQGYLVKTADDTVLDSYFAADSYSSTPDQRQDLDSYRDGAGELHRSVLPDVSTTIKFTTLKGLTLEEKIAFQTALASGLLDSQERKVQLTYWNDETNSYCKDTFYMPDIEFPILRHTAETIYYNKVTFKFIGYGADRQEVSND